MAADSTRIEELRRRVQKDPASPAFAQLAEEHRRAGSFAEAVRVARAGLARHAGYLSARVTLGRALIELEQFDEAQAELESVLQSAPDNLAALRALTEIHQRRADSLSPAAIPEEWVDVTLARPPAPGVSSTELDFDLTTTELQSSLDVLDGITLDVPQAADLLAESFDLPESRSDAKADPVLIELEHWLQAVIADREGR